MSSLRPGLFLPPDTILVHIVDLASHQARQSHERHSPTRLPTPDHRTICRSAAIHYPGGHDLTCAARRSTLWPHPGLVAVRMWSRCGHPHTFTILVSGTRMDVADVVCRRLLR